MVDLVAGVGVVATLGILALMAAVLYITLSAMGDDRHEPEPDAGAEPTGALDGGAEPPAASDTETEAGSGDDEGEVGTGTTAGG